MVSSAILSMVSLFPTVNHGVPVDYTIVYKITPDSPFLGHTSGIALVRNEYTTSPDRGLPLLIVLDEAIVNDEGILIGSDKEVDTK